MRKLIILISTITLISCASTTPTKYTSGDVNISPELFKNENSSTGWFAYGISLKAWKMELDENNKPDLFKREVYARSNTAKIWSELRENKSNSADPALDALVLIDNAGLMKEYVSIYIFQNSHSRLDDIAIKKFTDWMNNNLPNHKATLNPGVTVPIISL